MMVRGRLTALVSMLMCVGMVVPAGLHVSAGQSPPGSTDDRPVDLYPAVPDSSHLSAPVLAGGVLRHANGALATDTQLVVLVQPTNETMAGLSVGANLYRPAVAKATSDGRGQFVLRLDPATVQDYIEPDGYANFNVVSWSDAGEVVSYYFSREFGDKAAPGQWLDPQEVGTAANARLDNARSLRLTFAPGMSADGSNSTRDGQVTEAAPPMDRLLCDTVAVATLSNVQVHLAKYSGDSRIKTLLTYTNGSSSTLGVGFSNTGSFGTYSANGTQNKSSTFSVSFGSQSSYGADKEIVSGYDYVKLKTTCSSPTYVYYEVVPKAFAGGNWSYTISPLTGYTYCTPYQSGDHVERATSNNVTFSNGVNLAGPIGINLSAKTGYNTQTKITWDFSGNSNLCGNNAKPPTASLVAGYNR